ncbi:MAG TPA: TonB-dependent receptor [Gallionella sp.]|jgi:vitamin B12 transporter|nr:TonB-dependent receptor [Gallionella sp.]
MKHKQLFAALLCAATPLAHAETPDSLDEVVVTATRNAQPLNQSLAHTTIISQKEIQASQAVDVPSLLKNLAGVEIYQSGGIGKQSSLFMRGSNSSHTLVLLDGVRIGSATSGMTAIDQIMLDQVDRIEVVRGNVSSLYGSEAIGGVIQIFTKRGKGVPSFNVSGGAGTHNTQHAAAGFGGEVADTSFNVQVSKFKTEGVSSVKVSLVPTVNPDKDGYDNISLSANVSHAFNANHSLSGSVFQSKGDVQYDNTFGAMADVNVSTPTISKFALVSDNQLSEMWLSKLQLSQGTDDYKDYLNGVQGAILRTNSNQAAWQNTLTLSERNSLLLGAENLNQRVTGNTVYTQMSRRVNSLFGGYTALQGSHQLQLNLRQDHYSDFGSANTGLIGYGYEISDAWRVSASLSTAFKAPTFNDMYGPAGWGSNPGLRPERSHNNEIGLHYAADEQRIDAIYFDNRIRNLIAADSTWTMQNLNSARIDGLEAAYNGQYGDTGVKATLTLQNPRDSQTGQTLLRRAKSFSNVGVTQQFDAWRVGGEWQHSGARVDVDINTFARTTLAGYNVLNLTASYVLDKQLSLSLRVDNLFNSDYTLAHGYNTLGRTLFVGVSYRQ